ncbi:MAG TPA: hypothetical protein VEX18_18810, partial [Polyangiaceae bacterium]|nr:hypothetical protein [Polyangiaceae bacterium]
RGGNLQFELPGYTLLHVLRNMDTSGNSVARAGLRALRLRLPPGWSLSEPDGAAKQADVAVDLTAPDGRSASLEVATRARLDPKDVAAWAETTRAKRARANTLLVSRYLSPSTRSRLTEAALGYLDLTGNVRLAVSEPGLFIETQGASEDPNRQERPSRSLRGPKAGRLVRALIDCKQPPGVRELAALAKVDAGYVSRVVALLDQEALVTRVGRGRMQAVDWPALLRRWAQEAPLESRGEARTFFEPRGLSALTSRLARFEGQYAVTGGLAAAGFAPIAPARLATIWIRDAAEAATRLELRAAESGANVLLVEPSDDGVFEGATQREGVWFAAVSQVAADLLTSPGRGPSEGEELIDWMQAHEASWRR